MGISLEQHRAVTWTGAAGRIRKIIPHPSPVKLTLEEMTPEHQQPSWKLSGPWKLYLLLLIIILTLVCHGHCNTTGHHPHTSAASNMTIMTRPAAITADISIAVAGSISRQCLEALLLIGGVEQNPGPTQDDILAGLCADVRTTEVRDCLRRYKPENSLQQHRTDFNQCTKNVLVATSDYLEKPDQDLYNKTACVTNLICASRTYSRMNAACVGRSIV